MAILSDRVRRWLRDKFEQTIGVYYEGEEPPRRLREQVISFANLYPRATRAEWAEFAASFAEECYRAGYLRGVEWVERDEQRDPNAPTPEEIANDMDPDWIWRPLVKLEDGSYVVGDIRPEHEEIEDQIDRLKVRAREF